MKCITNQYNKMDINISILDYIKYDDVRQSGVTNMFDIRNVMALTGLSKEQIIYIMKNYDALTKKYN
tara:strand:- start:577 stop:777 length:201 start_codon:yes stop_codon:yes gene_type:complete